VKKEGQKIEVGLQEARAIVIIFVHHSRWVPFGLALPCFSSWSFYD
jgi:hypothetical protein